MISIRLAAENDIDGICSFDVRRDFIQRAVANSACYIIAMDEGIAGCAVLEYSFFEMGFVSMLYIHPGKRGQGIGAEMIRHLESVCRTEKLFTSTNLSNLRMQSLLAKLGYKLSGTIHDLDEGDPELVYVKYLR
jgi:N-acetylglutamate synthase-like GNAT family acetyltransferase